MKTNLLYLFFMIAASASVKAATVADSTKMLLTRAKYLSDASHPKHDEQQAMAIFKKLANQGNAEAMNDLGVLYSKGIGTQANTKAAANWYQQAGNHGYGRAWYNLGLLYKNGVSIPVDFTQAYQYFQQGAALNDAASMYAQGYMLYKGFGCKQNYEQAAALFHRGAALKDQASFYMLGLCYRNGYGVAVNPDSGNYYLKQAALMHDKRAIEELKVGAENQHLTAVPNLHAPAGLASGYQQAKHRLESSSIAGEYTGFIIRFDYSGKYMISQSGLKLKLTDQGNSLSGVWEEEGSGAISLNAQMADTAVIFESNSNQIADHYHQSKPLAISFTNAQLNLSTVNDTVYLSGTPHLYSPQTQEPQKPVFILLARTGEHTKAPLSNDAVADSVHFMAFPNPFSSSLKLHYTLHKAANVRILVTDQLTGATVYRSAVTSMAAGDYTVPVPFEAAPGHYIVTLQFGTGIRSSIVIKL